MKLFLQKSNYGRKLKIACAPLILSLFLPGIGKAVEFNPNSSLNVELVKAGARWENITGTVKDSKGEPLPGVIVTIKGTKTATSTNFDGVFRLNLPIGDETLVIKYLGFDSQEVSAVGKTQFNITLVESISNLDEVVVTGYGEKKRSEIIGSVATITGEELMDIPASNIAGALRNRIAGVSVDATSGRPGAGISLNIRNSTTSAQGGSIGATDEPLYIIDGITVTSTDFNNIDPSMVENITILKDASAAIYGASGAKGVVMVTTKRGKLGKPTLSYNGYIGVTDAAKKVEMLSGYEHAILLNDAYAVANAPYNSFFSDEDLEYIKNLDIPTWYDELWSSSKTQRHNVSISGGSDKIKFFAGGSYQNENGNYAGSKFDKYGFRSGIVAEILPGLKADVAFNVDHNIRFSKNSWNERDDQFFESIVTVPHWVPSRIDGKLVNFNNNNSGNPNPLGVLESGYYNRNKAQSYRVNASLTYKPTFIQGLTTRFQISQGGGNAAGQVYRPNYKVYNFERFGNNNQLFTDTEIGAIDAVNSSNVSLNPSLNRSNSYQGFFTMQYNNTFGLHSIDLTAGGEQTESNSEDLGVIWTDQELLGIDEFWAFTASNFMFRNRTISESVKRSFFGRFTYDFDKKYLLEAVARYDASSNFAKGNIWGLSPSIGAGWVISREDFFQDNVNFIDFLKVKVNYGITGDDRVAKRLWQERFEIDIANGYLYNETNTVGMNPKEYPNPSITWEKKQTFNAGVEMSMFNNKFDLGFEVFKNKVFDGFDGGLNDIVPMFAGFSAPVVNYRIAYNWGSEFTLGYRAKLAKDFSLSTSMNFGFGNSVVDRTYYNPYQLFENTPPDWKIGFGLDPRKYNSSNIGLRSLGMFRTQEQLDAFMSENPAYLIDGKVPQVGWLYFEDKNGDGKITDRDMAPMYSRTNAILSTGININLKYKAVSLSTNINARFGGKVFYDSYAMERPEPTVNVPSFWRDRWTPENPNGKFPRFDDASVVRKWRSDFWAVDGTTIRINNMTLAYTVPQKIISKLGISSARILATGNNLWTIKNPLNYKDPYSSYVYDYPTLRTISMGLSLGL